jgi:transcriptional regulator with XRE-family HTH domain
MSELVDKLRPEFQNEDYRHSYAEECVNTMIATQIKVLREERSMTQSALAEKAEMAQPRLSVMENADYSNWSINTLKRLARAFDVAVSVKFETFSNVVMDFEEMCREALSRPSFKDDPIFRSAKVRTHRAFRARRGPDADRGALQGGQQILPFNVTELVPIEVRRSKGYSYDQKGGVSDAALRSVAR